MTTSEGKLVETKPAKKESFFNRYLDPVDRLAEVIYGILIVMTFTMAFAGIDASYLQNQDIATQMVSRLFVAAFGCTIAWGIIDAVMYVLTSLFERAERQRVVRAAHEAKTEDDAITVLADELDDSLLDALSEEERDTLYRALFRRFHTKPLAEVSVRRDDIYGAIAVFLLAVIATLPVALPFLISNDPFIAMRLSNVIAVLMLFFVGFRWAKYVHANPWKIGLSLAAFGVVIVLIAIPLGG
jgi:VIT1/CCC1 family predicted Fe2+/Mn2+ transporter